MKFLFVMLCGWLSLCAGATAARADGPVGQALDACSARFEYRSRGLLGSCHLGVRLTAEKLLSYGRVPEAQVVDNDIHGVLRECVRNRRATEYIDACVYGVAAFAKFEVPVLEKRRDEQNRPPEPYHCTQYTFFNPDGSVYMMCF